MNYTISNEKLTLVVSSKGGEFQSVKDAEGQEYLWQGDAATWTDRGPNLFPYIGRMTEKSYKYQDTVYHMDIHGFLPYDEMELVEQKADSLTLRLVSSPETRKRQDMKLWQLMMGKKPSVCSYGMRMQIWQWWISCCREKTGLH